MLTVYGLLMNKSHQPVWSCSFADMIKREGLSLWPLSLPFDYFPACLLHGLPFATFFFFYLLRRLIHPSHAWENLNRKMRKIDEEEKAVIFFAYSQRVFPFCWRLLLFLWCWLTLFIFIGSWLFITFCRNLHSAANSPSSQILAFTQPKENSIACFSWELSNNISWQKKKNEEMFLLNF